MKQLSILLFFLFSFFIALSQPITNRSSTSITVQDGNLFALNSFRPAVYLDTSAANAVTSLDSCGKMIFTYSDNSYWLRACSPKRWIKILKTGDVSGAVWGTITGTLSDQTDLQNALDLKLNISDTATMLSPYPRGSGTANQISFWNGSRSLTGDAGLTYNSTTNTVVTDSVRAQTVQIDKHLLPPLSDTLAAAIRRGEIRFDTVTKSIVYNNGTFWSYVQSLVGNRPNIRLAAGVIRGTYNSGTGVTDWAFINNSTHDSLFFSGSITNSGNAIRLGYNVNPTKVITFIAVPDEGLAPYLTMGASVATTFADIYTYLKSGVQGGQLRGNGTTYAPLSRVSGWTISYTTSTGVLLLTPNVNSGLYESEYILLQYVGTNNGFRVHKLFSGLGGNTWGFQITDEAGNPITDAPTTADVLQIGTSINYEPLFSPFGGGALQQALFAGTTNIWVFAIYKE